MKKILPTIITTLLLSPFFAHAATETAYLTSSSGNPVKNNFGDCWVSSGTKTINSECGDVVVPQTPKKVKPVREEIIPKRIEEIKPEIKTEVKVITLQSSVLFEVNSDVISDQGEEVLLSKVLANSPITIKVDIAGHTDSRGSNKFNQKLGQKRADSVKSFLTSKGLHDVKISTQSFGEEMLLCKAKTEVCHQKNRRVEITLTTEQK